MPDSIPYMLLSIDRHQEIDAYLHDRNWLEPGESIRRLGSAGEGNMNLTLRVDTGQRSFIVKQSRPWVEKYPAIPAPENRVLMEAAFYRAVASSARIADQMPHLLDCDEQNFVVLLEDLGETADFTSIYNDGDAAFEPLVELAQWLAALHGTDFGALTKERLENLPMRQLNHEHLYRFPLQADNGLDLDAITPGLKRVAEPLQGDEAYRRAIAELGELYLQNGPCLLHGDFYPGSWVRSADDIWVIDPEFCFFGPAEFDLGILIGHLLLAGRPLALIETIFAHYRPGSSFRCDLALRFAGMEIMRRMIGVAQLPIAADLERKEWLLTTSRDLVLAPDSLYG